MQLAVAVEIQVYKGRFILTRHSRHRFSVADWYEVDVGGVHRAVVSHPDFHSHGLRGERNGSCSGEGVRGTFLLHDGIGRGLVVMRRLHEAACGPGEGGQREGRVWQQVPAALAEC